MHKMAESERTLSAQIALNTCVEHKHEELDMYCKTCKKPICTKCVKGDHHSHDWDSLNKVAKVFRKDTIRKKMEMESVSKSFSIGMENELNTLTLDEESNYVLNQSEMESTRTTIVENVNKMFTEMKSKSDNNHRSKMKSIQELKEQMRSKRKRINVLIKNMEIGAKDYTDADLIELHNDIEELIDDLQKNSRFPDCWYHRAIHKKGTHGKSTLAKIIGSIEVVEHANNAILEREFIISDSPTNSIIPWSDNEAWMHSMQTSRIKLFNKRGHPKDEIELNCLLYNFAVSDEKTVFVCDRDAMNVLQINSVGNAKVLFSTAPLHPLFVNLTRSEDLLVTLVDEDSDIRNKSSRRLMRRMSYSGEILREYEYHKDTRSPLFCSPCSPIEHFDGRICVINHFENEEGCTIGSILCLDGLGTVIFKYDGINDTFLPLDICCATKGQTLVSDSKNREIHILDFDGKFLGCLLTKDILHEKPYAIAIKGKTLWVGSRETGLVKVFRLEN